VHLTISIINDASGSYLIQDLRLSDYDILYSYYSEDNKFTRVNDPSDVPPFRDNMITRIQLTPNR
jgi:hypothetical protein